MVDWVEHSTGTVSLTAGSAIVVGVGTNWTVVKPGDDFLYDSGTTILVNKIASVEDGTHITLSFPWRGSSVSGASYKIIRGFYHTEPVSYGPRLAEALEQIEARVPAYLASWYGVSSGTSNLYQLVAPAGVTAYIDGMPIRFRAHITNTGASTIQVGNIGELPLVKADGTAVASGDIAIGSIITVVYDSVNSRFAKVDGGAMGSTSVSLEGSTMTGPLVLAADPITDMQAATKGYVDDGDAIISSAVTALDAQNLKKAGGTMTGPLVLAADPISNLGAATKAYVDTQVGAVPTNYVLLAGSTMTGPLILNDDPTNMLGAATKQYVDNSITAIPNSYLNLSGGTVTGNVTVTGTTTSASFNVDTTGYWTVTAGVVNLVFDTGDKITYDRATNTMKVWQANSTALTLQNGVFDFATIPTIAGQAWPTGNGGTGSYLPLSGGTVTGGIRALSVSAYGNSGTNRAFYGQTAAINRWGMFLGDNSPESSSNLGSNFSLYRYDDTGAALGLALEINRQTGLARFEKQPVIYDTATSSDIPLALSSDIPTGLVVEYLLTTAPYGYTAADGHKYPDTTDALYPNVFDLYEFIFSSFPTDPGDGTGLLYNGNTLVSRGTMTASQAYGAGYTIKLPTKATGKFIKI